MSLDTFINLIFSLIVINLILLGVVMVTSIKSLKQYKNYIDEKDIEEAMRKVLEEDKIEIL